MLRRLVRWKVALLIAIALPLASCGSGDGPAGPGGGGTGSTPPAPFGFAFPQTGHSVQLTFPSARVFGYRCTRHGGSGMTGVVNVSTGGLDSVVVGVGAGGNSFSPASVTIRPGGYVRWVNVSTQSDHTVTSN